MTQTISGHPAYNYGDPHLASTIIPGTKIKITTAKPSLGLFAHMMAACHKEVCPLQARNTWSHGYRPPRAGTGVSDHAGHAVDMWSDGIGANTGSYPTRMSKKQAAAMSKVLKRYKTKDGRYIFGWGVKSPNPGVDYPHTYHRINDPMHVFKNPGITDADMKECRIRMGIKTDGTEKVVTAPTPAPVKPAKPALPVVAVGNVQPGSVSHDVVYVQTALSRLTHLVPPYSVGWFDKPTKQAYIEYQKSLGYSGKDADGAPGKASLTALGKETGIFTV